MEVKIKIKDPVLRSYLAGLFTPKDNGYAINMDTFTGTVISSLVEPTNRPPKTDIDKTTVIFHLSKSRYNDEFRNKFLVVSPEAESKINAVLRREFETNFTSFCTEMKIQGFKLKDIIPLFIAKNNMYIFDGDIDTLKKRYYRNEIATLKKIEESLRQKAYSAAKRAKKLMNNAAIL